MKCCRRDQWYSLQGIPVRGRAGWGSCWRSAACNNEELLLVCNLNVCKASKLCTLKQPGLYVQNMSTGGQTMQANLEVGYFACHGCWCQVEVKGCWSTSIMCSWIVWYVCTTAGGTRHCPGPNRQNIRPMKLPDKGLGIRSHFRESLFSWISGGKTCITKLWGSSYLPANRSVQTIVIHDSCFLLLIYMRMQ